MRFLFSCRMHDVGQRFFLKNRIDFVHRICCLKSYNVQKWEIKFTLGLNAAKNTHYIKKSFKIKVVQNRILCTKFRKRISFSRRMTSQLQNWSFLTYLHGKPRNACIYLMQERQNVSNTSRHQEVVVSLLNLLCHSHFACLENFKHSWKINIFAVATYVYLPQELDQADQGLQRSILLRLNPSRRRRFFLEKKRKIKKGPEKSAYYDKLV